MHLLLEPNASRLFCVSSLRGNFEYPLENTVKASISSSNFYFASKQIFHCVYNCIHTLSNCDNFITLLRQFLPSRHIVFHFFVMRFTRPSRVVTGSEHAIFLHTYAFTPSFSTGMDFNMAILLYKNDEEAFLPPWA